MLSKEEPSSFQKRMDSFMSTEAHLENGELGWGSFIWRPATLSINLQKKWSSRGGQLLRSTFGGHFKALGDMHNCSDFLKNIYSVVNDVQNATELVVVPSTMRNRFSLSWDTDPGSE